MNEINAKITEFEARIETGIHYRIPYPRPVNVVPGATGKDPCAVTPVYLDSYKAYVHPSNVARSPPASIPIYEE